MLPANARSVLAYGAGRSYGDSCLNDSGVLLSTVRLDNILAFDRETGIVRCEAGVLLADLLALTVPAGWFLPVTPGTRYVTVGGAVANDIHGKNHHVDGSFGHHVRRLELRRSTGERLELAPGDPTGLFAATIGGLGLTGLITWVELALLALPSAWIDQEAVRFEQYEEFLQLSRQSAASHRYGVAWFDALRCRGSRMPGVFLRGNHAAWPDGHDQSARWRVGPRKPRVTVPFDAPAWLLNQATVGAFNATYRRTATWQRHRRVHYLPFFYPLDAIGAWNRLYGRRGFLQYQFVVPHEAAEAVPEVVRGIRLSGETPFLNILKVFGERRSMGLISFPRPGITLAIDLPMRGSSTLALCDRLDALVLSAGGALYPAKDARMGRKAFRASFPGLGEFLPYVDPRFSSGFWRRVNEAHAS